MKPCLQIHSIFQIVLSCAFSTLVLVPTNLLAQTQAETDAKVKEVIETLNPVKVQLEKIKIDSRYQNDPSYERILIPKKSDDQIDWQVLNPKPLNRFQKSVPYKLNENFKKGGDGSGGGDPLRILLNTSVDLINNLLDTQFCIDFFGLEKCRTMRLRLAITPLFEEGTELSVVENGKVVYRCGRAEKGSVTTPIEVDLYCLRARNIMDQFSIMKFVFHEAYWSTHHIEPVDLTKSDALINEFLCSMIPWHELSSVQIMALGCATNLHRGSTLISLKKSEILGKGVDEEIPAYIEMDKKTGRILHPYYCGSKNTPDVCNQGPRYTHMNSTDHHFQALFITLNDAGLRYAIEKMCHPNIYAANQEPVVHIYEEYLNTHSTSLRGRFFACLAISAMHTLEDKFVAKTKGAYASMKEFKLSIPEYLSSLDKLGIYESSERVDDILESQGINTGFIVEVNYSNGKVYLTVVNEKTKRQTRLKIPIFKARQFEGLLKAKYKDE